MNVWLLSRRISLTPLIRQASLVSFDNGIEPLSATEVKTQLYEYYTTGNETAISGNQELKASILSQNKEFIEDLLGQDFYCMSRMAKEIYSKHTYTSEEEITNQIKQIYSGILPDKKMLPGAIFPYLNLLNEQREILRAQLNTSDIDDSVSPKF